jgi:hypothetical protein
MYEFLKLIVQPVCLERDVDGNIVGERPAEPTALYSLESVGPFIKAIQDELVRVNAELEQIVANGGTPLGAAMGGQNGSANGMAPPQEEPGRGDERGRDGRAGRAGRARDGAAH